MSHPKDRLVVNLYIPQNRQTSLQAEETLPFLYPGWTDGRTDRQMDGRMDGQTDGWTDKQMDRRMDKRTDGRTEGHTDGRTDRWTDGRTDGQGDSYLPLPLRWRNLVPILPPAKPLGGDK